MLLYITGPYRLYPSCTGLILLPKQADSCYPNSRKVMDRVGIAPTPRVPVGRHAFLCAGRRRSDYRQSLIRLLRAGLAALK